MTVLRRCRVNAALTIQLFSQLFHFINMWLFNRLILEPQLLLCTRLWAQRIRRRLALVESWAEQQGLELAAECHLAKIIQATYLLESSKMPHDVGKILATCESLNSLQVQRLLDNYIPGPGEVPLRRDVVDQLVIGAQNTVDEMLVNEGLEPRLDEPVNLQLPFLLPDDGYSCDFLKGIPGGLTELLRPLLVNGICSLTVNHHSPGTWMVYMKIQEDCHTYQNLKPAAQSGQSQSLMEGSKSPDLLHLRTKQPEILAVTFGKVKNSLGLSIIAAKGEGQMDKCIYVKSVVAGGGAAMDGRIQAGDQLLEVDGHSLIGISQERAAEMMTQTGQTVTLKVARQAAIFHGLEKLIGLQSSSVTSRAETGAAAAGGGGKVPVKMDVPSHPLAQSANSRPLSGDFRNSPKPLNQQLEAKSTPVLSDARFHDPRMTGGDAYSSNYRYSPQQQQQPVVMAPQVKAQNVQLDSLRHASSSQPDLVSRRTDINRDDVTSHQPTTGPLPTFPGGSDDGMRRSYGPQVAAVHMKAARSSPNIAADPQKGFSRSEDNDHQRVLEWQQRNDMLAENDQQQHQQQQWNPKRPSPSHSTEAGLVGPGFKNTTTNVSQSDTNSRMATDGVRMGKPDPVDVAKQPVLRPVYQPLQPSSKKGPGYATQMLFPASAPIRQTPQLPKDNTTSNQAYQPHQQPVYGMSRPMDGHPLSQPNQGYRPVANALTPNQPETDQSHQQLFAPMNPQNFSRNVPPPGQVAPTGQVAPPRPMTPQLQMVPLRPIAPQAQNQNIDYQPISEFYRGFIPSAVDAQRARTAAAAVDSDFPPPPTDLHLAQLATGDASLRPPPFTDHSFYGQNQPSLNQPSMSSQYPRMPTENNNQMMETGRFSQEQRPMHTPRISQPASSSSSSSGTIHSYPVYVNDAPSQGQGHEGYLMQSHAEGSSSAPGSRAATTRKPPPPVAVKPKTGPVTSTTPVVTTELKPYSTFAWEEKDAKEKRRDEEIRIKRFEEIKRLQNRPYLSPEEQNKLQRLVTEAEFDRRAEEASDEKDSGDEAPQEMTNSSQPLMICRMDEDHQQRDRNSGSTAAAGASLHPDTAAVYAKADRTVHLFSKVDRQPLMDNRSQADAPQKGVGVGAYYGGVGGIGGAMGPDLNTEQPPLKGVAGAEKPVMPKSQGRSVDYPRPWSSEATGGNQTSVRRYLPEDVDSSSSGRKQPLGGGTDGDCRTSGQSSVAVAAAAEYPRQMGMSGYQLPNQDTSTAYRMDASYNNQQVEYSAYGKPVALEGGGGGGGGEVFNTSSYGQQQQWAADQQQQRSGTVSALKQPDSQTGSGNVKKSVTFNENIGVTEYTINRSYGSTSSESSFPPQSPEQSTAAAAANGLRTRQPCDEATSSPPPPPPPPASYMASAAARSSYAPSPAYLLQQQQQPRSNMEHSYTPCVTGIGAEQQQHYAAYGSQGANPGAATRPVTYMASSQGHQEPPRLYGPNMYASDTHHQSQPGGGGYQFQTGLVSRQPPYQRDPIGYSRQQQQ